MDLADASLVAVAENRGIRRRFTIGSDFSFIASAMVRCWMSCAEN